ncbi:hypothetical protein GKC49_01040 [Pantoea agglomerans]|uniref:Uncharacterized protein n=1 Tax=Enterobacter agglomerans TaxID=549 RepID=A0A7X2SU04_ENTAG|nr:hypothetical protein [Pantoea agglomerans]
MRIECSADELNFDYEILCCGSTIFIRQENGTEFRFTNGVLYRLSISDHLFEEYKNVENLYSAWITSMEDFWTLLGLNLFGSEYDSLFLDFLSTKHGISGFDTLADLVTSRIHSV